MNAKLHQIRKKSRLEKALIQQLTRCTELKNMYLKEANEVEGSNIKYFQGLADAFEDVLKRNNIPHEKT